VGLFILTTSQEMKSKLESVLSDFFELQFIKSGDEALSKMRDELPQAIVMDYSIYGPKTFNFIDKVRNKAPTRHLPFIIISRESSNAFVEKAVRSGVSHYIGMPFDTKMLIEKIQHALEPENHPPPKERRISLPVQIPVQVTSFGRISFISGTGVHLETHIKPELGSSLFISSPLSAALKLDHMEVAVTSVTRDTYYNYPYAVDADWKDAPIQAEVQQWINAHRHLNSPKKIKILFLEPDLHRQEIFTSKIDQQTHSVRFAADFKAANSDLLFMKPAGVVVPYEDWQEASPVQQKEFIKNLEIQKVKLIMCGPDQPASIESTVQPFQCPDDEISILFAVEQVLPATKPDPNLLYFNKSLEDSRVKIHFEGNVVVLQEIGMELELAKEITPPCNLQLDLKVLNDATIRNPYVRAWPPASKVTVNGHAGVRMQTHFLGINEQQGQAVRKWLIDEELKNNRKKLEAIAPKATTSEEIEEMKKKEAEKAKALADRKKK
jgi:CheY-like chemotaxis protein